MRQGNVMSELDNADNLTTSNDKILLMCNCMILFVVREFTLAG